MKKLAIAVMAVLSLATVVALVVPRVIDWSQYKETIGAKVHAATGRELAIDGDVGVSLLPIPAVWAKGLRLASIPGAASPDMARIDMVRLRLALLPLLAGEVQVQSVRVIAPRVELQMLPDGRANWRFEKRGNGPAAPASRHGSPSRHDDEAAPFDLDGVTVENGAVTYRDAAGLRTLAGDVDAVIAAESLKGPFHAKGTVTTGAAAVAFEVRLGAVGEARASTINLDLALRGSPAKLRFGGLVSGLSDAVTVRGKVVGDGKSLGKVLELVGGIDQPRLNHPFAVTANLAASSQRVTIDELVARLGGAEATGKVTATIGAEPDVDVNLALNGVDLHAWLEAPPPASPAPGSNKPRRVPRDNGKSRTATAPERTVPTPTPAFAIPRDIAVAVNLTAEAMAYRNGVIRKAKVNATLSGGELTVSQASALLPGDTEVSAFGFLAAENGQPAFDVTVDGRSGDLRAVLGPLGVDVSVIPGDRLHRFALTGSVKGTPTEMRFEKVAAELDTTRLTGAGTVRLGARPAVAANLNVDNFNVDGYFPRGDRAEAKPVPAPAGQSAPKGRAEAPAAPQVAEPPPGPLDVLNAFDANLRLRFGTLAIKNTLLRDVLVDGSLIDRVMTVRSATVGDVVGAAAGFSGEIGGFGGEPHVKDLAYAIRTRQAARLARFLGINLPIDAEKLGSVAMVGTVNGSSSQISLSSRNELGGTVVTVDGTVANILAGAGFDLTMEASHASFADFVNLFTDGYRPAGGNVGAFAMHTRAVGAAGDKIALEDFRIRLGPVNVSGAADLALTSGRPKLTAQLTAGDIDLNRLLPAKRAAGGPAPGGEDIRLGGNPLLRQASLATSRPPPSQPPPSRPMVNVRDVAAANDERWSREPFDLTFLNTFDADLALNGNALMVDDYTITEPHVKGTLVKGLVTVANMGGNLFGGTIRGEGSLNAAAVPRMTAHLVVTNANIRQALATSANIRIADGALDLTTDLASSGRSMRDMMSGLDGTGRMAVRDGVVTGFDLDAVNRRLSDIRDPAGLITALQTGLNGGATRFKTVNGTFRAKDGVVHTDDLRMVAASGEALAVGSIDLPAWTTDSRIDFRVAAHPDAPPLALRLTGPLENPRRVFDIQGLQNHLIGKGLDRVFRGKGKGADILRQLIPNSSTAESKDDDTGSAPPSGTPAIDLGKLLKRFGR